MSRPWYEQPVVYLVVFGVCIAAGLMPMWSVQHQPGVDFPQHLFLIHVLQSVNDPGSFYSSEYISKPGLTYVTFYYTVRVLAAVFGVETAMKLWLTLVLGGIPISIALLAKAFGRSPWLGLLAVPLIYTDNFYWGLISFVSSLPFTFLTLAFFVEVLQETMPRRSTVIWLAVSLVLLQLTHAAGMIFPAMALPLLLVTTPSDWARRKRALLGLAPGALLFLAWGLAGVEQGRRLGKPGEPWTASAPLLDPRNFTFTPLRQRKELLKTLLANGFWKWADRPPLIAWVVLMIVVLVVAVAALALHAQRKPPTIAALRPLLLLLLALGCYFFLPMDITGYMYQIFPRYSQVAALLAIPVLSLPAGWATQGFIAAGTALAIFFSTVLTPQFRAFDEETKGFEQVASLIAPNSKIMHLVMDQGSAVSTHAVYLHYAALAAMRRDGIPSFSLALDPSFPVGYRNGRPPAPPWEWNPAPFSWDDHARHYDYFLVRGRGGPVGPRLFGEHANDVELVYQTERWTLFHKNGGAEP